MYTANVDTALWDALQDVDDTAERLSSMIAMLIDATGGRNMINEETLGYYAMVMAGVARDLRKEVDTAIEVSVQKAPECCNTEGQA